MYLFVLKLPGDLVAATPLHDRARFKKKGISDTRRLGWITAAELCALRDSLSGANHPAWLYVRLF